MGRYDPIKKSDTICIAFPLSLVNQKVVFDGYLGFESTNTNPEIIQLN
jgi:hypothetical protein